MIIADGLGMRYPAKNRQEKEALKKVSFHVPEGMTVGIAGPSGAGKTTLLKLITGLLKPSEGLIFTGKTVPDIKKRSFLRGIGFLPALNSVLEASESIESNFRKLQIIYGIDPVTFKKELDYFMKAFQMKSYLYKTPDAVSLGMKKRAEITAVLLHRPKLIVLDEPFTGLDANAKQAFESILEERKRQGATILISTHELHEVSRLCERVLVLKEGRCIYYGKEKSLHTIYSPMERLSIIFEGKIPDLEDLPVRQYRLETGEKKQLIITYPADKINTAEIMKVLIKQIEVKEVTVHIPQLEDIIRKIEASDI